VRMRIDGVCHNVPHDAAGRAPGDEMSPHQAHGKASDSAEKRRQQRKQKDERATEKVEMRRFDDRSSRSAEKLSSATFDKSLLPAPLCRRSACSTAAKVAGNSLASTPHLGRDTREEPHTAGRQDFDRRPLRSYRFLLLGRSRRPAVGQRMPDTTRIPIESSSTSSTTPVRRQPKIALRLREALRPRLGKTPTSSWWRGARR